MITSLTAPVRAAVLAMIARSTFHLLCIPLPLLGLGGSELLFQFRYAQ